MTAFLVESSGPLRCIRTAYRSMSLVQWHVSLCLVTLISRWIPTYRGERLGGTFERGRCSN